MSKTRPPTGKPPWLVRKHHALRTLSFALLMGAVTLHLWDTGASPWLWAYLATQLLGYPHLVYLRARFAKDPVATELTTLLLDAFLLGLCAAVLGLPLWIAFSMAMGALINNAFNKGWRGSLTGSVAFASGVLVWLATGRFEWHPETHLLTTLWCMGGVTAYVLALGDIAFIRIRQLRQARHENNQAAAALGEANASLQQQLDEINSLQVKLREQVLRDPLTGQYNRRYLDAALERELLRCQRQHCHVALLMIDIDHFKRINDNFGHQAGDEVLRQMGFMLGAHARSHDVVCRYGGEEFLIVLPELPVDAAHQRAEQIRLAVGNQHFQTAAGTLRLTLSVGVAAFPLHGHTVDALLHSADTALYAAKHQGRNRVVVSGAAG